MKIFAFLFSFALISILLQSCGSSSEIGTEKTVETSSSNSDWISTPTKEEGDNYFFTGQMTKAKD